MKLDTKSTSYYNKKCQRGSQHEDQKSGEEYIYDSTELNASVLPVVPAVVAFIARLGVKQAIKYFGKKDLKKCCT